jgi:hypothetical protein
MNGSEIIFRLRNLSGELDPNGRFPDTSLYDHINSAQDAISDDIEWPRGRWSANTVITPAPVGTYQLPEIVKLLRLYVNGQPVPATTKDLIEGNQIGLYDDTGTGYNPQWTQQAATAYPVTVLRGWPRELVPWVPGRAPEYFREGANITLVPKPSNVVPMVIDVVDAPPILVQGTDVSVFPRRFKDCLCWKSIEYMRAGDTGIGDNDTLANAARDRYQIELAKAIEWNDDFQPLLPKGFVTVTSAPYFQSFPVAKHRTTSSGWGD